MKKFYIVLLILSSTIYSQTNPMAYVDSGAISNGISCGIGEIFVIPINVYEKTEHYPNEIAGKESEIDKNQMKELIVFPNPTAGIVNIDTEFDIRTLSVYNSEGKWIMDADLKNVKSLDLANLPSGLYNFVFCGTDFKPIKIIKR